MNNMKTFKTFFSPDKAATFILYFSIIVFIIAFNFSDNPKSGWYQQFFPDLHGAYITDITFTDSLTGYAVTKRDTGGISYILKSTNGGDNWFMVFNNINPFTKVQFLKKDINTGFACTDFVAASGKLYKTTNAGLNWNIISSPVFSYADMCVISETEIWITSTDPFDGGLYRTTNGGQNWELKYYNISHNAEKIYMYNSNFGFMQLYSLYRTTNAGTTWESNSGGEFTDFYFIDTLTGWKAHGDIKYTTNGGISWTNQYITPVGGNIGLSSVVFLSGINADTIWGFGRSEIYFPGSGYRGFIHKTTNGGLLWGYQIPLDTSIYITEYNFGQFVDAKKGWAFPGDERGAHTTMGGNNTTIFVGIKNHETKITENFYLLQNYPNPFNPKTKIEYELQLSGNVILKVIDLRGKEIITLINKRQSTGKYEIEFDGSNLPSGVYFYSLFVDNAQIDTKKMLLIK